MDDLLSLEKLEQGKVNVLEAELELEAFVSEILGDLGVICKNDQHINYHHSGNLRVVIDKKIFQNILLNLVSNAVKYSERDVQVLTESTDHHLKLIVADKGIGIPEDELEKMFNKFFRARNTQNIQGTGLGLTIVKRYVDLLDGTIEFTSKTNEGSTFLISIPKHNGNQAGRVKKEIENLESNYSSSSIHTSEKHPLS